MKRIFSIALLSGSAILLLSPVTFGQQTPTPTKSTKTEKHIKMVKVDDNGKKTELDTVITNDAPFVWQGDTIGGGKEMKWIHKEGFEMDSMHMISDMQSEYKIEDDGAGNVMILKSGKGGNHMIMTPVPPGAPMPMHAPGMMMFRSQHNKNVIDLSDPGIISYDKKIQKDGTEKITIVRKQVNEEDEELMEDVMFDAPHGSDVFFYGNAPEHVKTIKVIKSDDGTTKVIEDEKVIHLKGDNGETMFVGDDGEVIHVREMNEGDQKKVEVEVEKKEEVEKK